ncbi:hypothetical protein RHMOL_Rhmol11G0056400 [Rhododendron molle]|uniref:Uncharacterized protein n=1 Tax=Rhododendron molle TaxID=49168 RepID=A0ACC0LQ19_RHOML|nr:hypothetical protein RHMOL_Rhmol11G0056400 [Rhododendron molle]
MDVTVESRGRTPEFHSDLKAGSRGRYTIAAGRVLAPASIGEFLVAWWLGMEATPRRTEFSRGEAPMGCPAERLPRGD